MNSNKTNGIINFLLLPLLAAALLLSLSIGPAALSLSQAFKDLLENRFSESAIILWEIRMPRTALAFLVGATLGLAGASMQGLFRNPLAEPGILGVTGGAVFGAVLVFYTHLLKLFPLALPIGGIIGALISVLLLYALVGSLTSLQSFILAGVALNTLAFAGTSLALNMTKNPYAALEIIFWQMGSLADRSWDHVFLILPFILAGWALLFWDQQALNALSLGEEVAQSLGVSLSQVRLRIILGTALCVGACVSICGSIGFIGLVIPHLLRPLVHQEPGKLLGASVVGGAILLLFADIGVRIIPTAGELKVGVLTSLIGGPFFIFLIFKMRNKIL